MKELEDSPLSVLDFDGRPVGWVRNAVMNPRTHATRTLLVNLAPEARARLGTEAMTMAIPARHVATVRRDHLELGVRMTELDLGPALPN